MIPPTIELTDARLRQIRPGDAAAWHACLSDPEVVRLTSFPAMSLDDVRTLIERVRAGYATDSSCTWALADQASDVLIGTCGFNSLSRAQGRAEIAYDLARSRWGRGLMTQAVRACVEWAFAQPEFNRIQAFVMVGNARSVRVLEKAHFTREGLAGVPDGTGRTTGLLAVQHHSSGMAGALPAGSGEAR